MLKVSVIIPCYNSEKYISDTLDSVIQQTYPNIEIICIDDGSEDTTNEIVLNYSKKYSNIRLIKNDGKGACAARNTGFRNSIGDYIQFLDSDDILLKDKLSRQLQASNADLILSDYERRSNDLKEVIATFKFNSIHENPLTSAVKSILLTSNPIYKRSLVEKLNGYSLQYNSAQDWDFNLRAILSLPTIEYIPGVFFYHRQVHGSISHDWIKVSVNQCKVLNNLKSAIQADHRFNQDNLNHILTIHFNTLVQKISSNDRIELTGFFNNWYTKDISFLKSFNKKLLASIFGIGFVIWFTRFINSLKKNRK